MGCVIPAHECLRKQSEQVVGARHSSMVLLNGPPQWLLLSSCFQVPARIPFMTDHDRDLEAK